MSTKRSRYSPASPYYPFPFLGKTPIVDALVSTVRPKLSMIDDVYDVNGDNQINCIDYAILFKMMYGHAARIIRNENPRTGMHHLFNLCP
jgi:hypothetical protein